MLRRIDVVVENIERQYQSIADADFFAYYAQRLAEALFDLADDLDLSPRVRLESSARRAERSRRRVCFDHMIEPRKALNHGDLEFDGNVVALGQSLPRRSIFDDLML